MIKDEKNKIIQKEKIKRYKNKMRKQNDINMKK